LVDGASLGCSDTDPGAGTEATPYCTISAAAAARGGPGTTLLVKPAIYRERVNVPASGAEGSPFIFQAVGSPVILDGADDFASPALWTPFSGSVYLAAGVTWVPRQVFVDGARLAPSTAAPADLPPNTFRHVLGEGLYVNLGGDTPNPGDHQTLVGRRTNGFHVPGRAFVTIDGFTVTRADERGIFVRSLSDTIAITRNIVSFSGRQGILAEGASNVLIAENVVSDSSDHGIALFSGTSGSTIQDNEVFRSADPAVRRANGINLSASPNNLVQRNRAHDNQDSGIQFQQSSPNTISLQNRSWNNGDHGFEHLQSTGAIHVGDVANGNFRHGFSVDGGSTGTQIFNSIAVNNGLTGEGFNLLVDPTSTSGLVSDYNIFWNSTSRVPIRYNLTNYATIAAFTAATGQDANSTQADPLFVDPTEGDFRLQAGSPAIDAADSSVASWPAIDANGRARADDPATGNSGAGPVPYADRGALEFLPPPVAALTASPASGLVPLLVTFDAAASFDPDGGMLDAYTFDFGDGTIVGPQAEATASHTYATAGTYTASVTVTDDEGGTGSTSQVIIVNAPPNGTIDSPAGDMMVVAGDTVSFTGTGTDPDNDPSLTFLWDFGGGAPNSTAEDPGAVMFSTPGTYTVTFTVTDSRGAADPTPDTRVITVNPNLVGNPSFETDTSGWSAYPTATTVIERVAGGLHGEFALEVRGPNTLDAFGINDRPDWVAQTVAAGTRYRFTAWIRSASSIGQVRLRIREYLNSVHLLKTYSSPLVLSPAWQMLTVDVISQAAGSHLDVQVLDYTPVTRGEVFRVDHVSIQVIP
jgi:parallel beta-helix repeat protein